MPVRSVKEILRSYLAEINLGSGNVANLKASLVRIRARSSGLMYFFAALLVVVFLVSVYISLKFGSSDVFTTVVTADAGLTFLLGALIRYFYKEATGADYMLATIEGLGDIQVTEVVKSVMENYFRA